MFIKNAWYVACRPEEIQDKPLGRTICGEKSFLPWQRKPSSSR